MRHKLESGIHFRELRHGFTIIELMVVVAIVGIIVALALPAVVSIRSSARSLQCKNNLHNLGLAMHNLQGTTKHFPRSAYIPDEQSYPFSCFVELLPYLEKQSVFDSLRFRELPNSIANAEVAMDAAMTILRCPEQSSLSGRETSYLGNGGTGLTVEMAKRSDGFMTIDGTNPGDFPKGLSNIVAMAECASLNAGSPKNRGAIFLADEPPATISEWNSFVNRCRQIDSEHLPEGVRLSNIGHWWSFAGNLRTIYWHALPLGENSCDWYGRGGTQVGTANSSHSGGVNILRGDGSAGMQSRLMDSGVWEELGRR